ncbi:hypothetical protein CVT24_001683 [Panaeolus cyanescens]|uniref:Telomerase Cajal body protein 1 n=1 Tax=Panaeolus cyanescens TaxID=181874 RepID=A0A409YFN2_9AGAR|nr:hypothetical protein CVT24_001683 [Panaeolus cyanescens]
MSVITENTTGEYPTWIPVQFNLKTSPALSAKHVLNPDLELEESNNFGLQMVLPSYVIVKTTPSAPFIRTFQVPRRPSPILDFLWYPTASPYDPATFCFVASVRECPVKLLDATDGRLRASYSIVDHRERQVAPHSLAFNLTAQRLYCGFENAIEIFDVSRPGEGVRQNTTPSKKSKDGLKGIISALAFSPSYNGGESFYAAGTFSPNGSNIAMFSDEREEPLFLLGGGPYAGVTQLQFNPMRPHILYAAYRGQGTGQIYSWDVRLDMGQPCNIYQVPSSPSIKPTNQKFRFDIDAAGQFLSVGDQAGRVSVFNLNDSEDAVRHESGSLTGHLSPELQFQAHDDAVGSVSIHPSQPIFATASGSRHFLSYDGNSDSSDAEDNPRQCPIVKDSSIKVWDFSDTKLMQ